MRTDAAGLAFIGREEGCILHPYPDTRNFATIFIGHLIAMRPPIRADWIRWRPLTRSHAIRTLHVDMRPVESVINRLVRVKINQNEFNAMASLTLNIGTGGFASSTVLRRLNAGDRRGAARAFLLWRRGGPRGDELLPRRRREAALFLRGDVDPLHLLEPDERKWVHELDVLRNKHKNVARRRALVKVLTHRRKHIWRVAQTAGWKGHHRLERYRILRSRTTR